MFTLCDLMFLLKFFKNPEISVLLWVDVLFVPLPWSSCSQSPPYEETAPPKRLTLSFTHPEFRVSRTAVFCSELSEGLMSAGKGFLIPSQVLTQEMLSAVTRRNGKCYLK